MARTKEQRTRKQVRRRILTLCRTLGVPIDTKLQRMVYRGDGRVPAGPQMGNDEVCHEAGHWIVSPVRFRDLRNYGLGPSPEDGAAECKDSAAVCTNLRPRGPLKKGDPVQTEEELASVFGILMLAACGGEWQDTLLEHSWFDSPVECLQHMDALHERGFLNAPLIKATKTVRLYMLSESIKMAEQHGADLARIDARHTARNEQKRIQDVLVQHGNEDPAARKTILALAQQIDAEMARSVTWRWNMQVFEASAPAPTKVTP